MRATFLTAGLLIGLSPLSMAAQIYKWIDAQGITHFDAKPPSGQPATVVVTPSPSAARPAASLNSGTIGDQQAIDKSVKKQVAEQQTELKTFCEQVRTNLAQLRNNPRLREEVEGELRRLDDTQRQERIGETQKQIADNCM
ncbi:DUF4124 domain-containing protein [Pseudomonas fluorescens]|jgi:hypothetical protein|uniref:DUF4124 domain-containing protein n=1 Tax=Pseudomonas TaxID=286 RepID=UPI001A931C36|nr:MULTISPECIES: DUF4124 domain-containing protein [Pseudomonas]MDZ5432660.1 DUF4124 domain-containing protein [Pseudomonas fluorescens]